MCYIILWVVVLFNIFYTQEYNLGICHFGYLGLYTIMAYKTHAAVMKCVRQSRHMQIVCHFGVCPFIHQKIVGMAYANLFLCSDTKWIVKYHVLMMPFERSLGCLLLVFEEECCALSLTLISYLPANGN